MVATDRQTISIEPGESEALTVLTHGWISLRRMLPMGRRPRVG